jgi:hypothetical protein
LVETSSPVFKKELTAKKDKQFVWGGGRGEGRWRWRVEGEWRVERGGWRWRVESGEWRVEGEGRK